MISDMAELGMDTLVLTCSSLAYADSAESYAPVTVFPQSDMVCPNAMDILMEEAARLHLSVYLSVGFYGNWVDPVGNMRSAEVEERAKTAAQTLYAAYASNPAFAGWYLPDETEAGPYFAPVFMDYAARYCRFLRAIDPAKKILIADVIGLCVDKMLGPAALDPSQVGDIMTRIATLDTGTAWLVALAYTFQIYFDFAGYSDMAIGLGRIMGFKFPENFDNPYTSRSITEFWRRWHKTLGAFIMNYLYIPLGGNRKGTGRMYLNLWLCFLLSGLWHGASWNFVVWGALHGLFICLDKLFLGKVMKKIGTVPSVILTFITVCVIWVFFRIESLNLAWTFVTRMFAFDFSGFAFDGNAQVYTIMVVAALFSFFTLTGWGKKVEQKVYYTDYSDRQHIWVWIVAAIVFIFCVAALNATSFSPFIYFRF